MKKYLDMLVELGAVSAKEIQPRTVKTAAWVSHKCQHGCPGYGKSLCCPPHTPTYDKTQAILDDYQKGILFHSHDMAIMNKIALKVRDTLFLDGYYKALALGCGSCHLCEKCNLEKCVHPQEALASVESCGIDVFSTARANGFEINTLKSMDETINCYALILVE